MMPIQYLQGPETSNFEIDAESIGQLDYNDGVRQEGPGENGNQRDDETASRE